MRTRSTWILLGVLALLALVVYGVEEKGIGAKPTPTPQPLLFQGVTVASVREVRVEKGEAVLRLVRDGEGWKVLEPQAGPADGARVEKVLVRLLGAVPVRVLTTAEIPLEEAGLAPEPRARVTLALEDGREIGFDVGDRAPAANAYYTRWPEAPEEVRLVNVGILGDLLRWTEAPPWMPTPTPGAGG